ncbi:MAG: glycosyl hydrolase [Armatimonadetes bacterium]|nr:glycosyl hydrolase [Armatimonadota bacterium]
MSLHRFQRSIWVELLLLLPVISVASPKPITPSFFGINGVGYFHYLTAPDAHQIARQKMNWMNTIGAKSDRFDFWWSVMEPAKGKWDWKDSDWLINFYRRNKISMLPILCYNAAWMKNSPSTSEDDAEYARFVYRVVRRYRKRVHYWEIWNEPNIPTFWKPQPDAKAYTAMLKAAYLAAHRADPHCVVVGAAANEADINWLLDIAKFGGARYMDAVSFHPYSMSDGPDQMDLARQIEDVRLAMKLSGRPHIPLWITEMGWTSSISDPASVNRQSRYLVESYTIAAAEEIQRLFWFSLQDWGAGKSFQGWGCYSPDGRPKQTALAYRHLVHQLTGARFVGYLPLYKKSTAGSLERLGAGYIFQRGRQTLLIVWARNHRTAKLNLPGTAQITNLYGNPIRIKGRTLFITDRPLYIDFNRSVHFKQMTVQRPHRRNLLVNPSFERVDGENPYGWHRGVFYGGNDTGTFSVIKGSAKGGRISAGLSRTTNALWESYPIPAMPGERYTLTGFIKATDATGDNGMQLLFLSGPGWGWKGGPETKTVTGTTEGWKKMTVRGIVPQDADVVRVNLFSRNNTGLVQYDDLNLTRK